MSASPQSSLLELLAGKSRDEINELLADFSDAEAAELLYDWRGIWARPEQLTPAGDWLLWFILAGRGFGKTRTGAEATVEVASKPEACGGRVHLVAPTAGDARDVMVEGESGILACSPPWFMPKYQPSKRRLRWPNGVVGYLFSADEPERLRGPQCGWFWADEMAAWRYLEEAWDNLMLGCRLGLARGVVTTTPKPRKLVRELVKAKSTHVTRGSTYDNLENLAASFKRKVLARYEGTTLGRQELHAELLDEAPGALWKRARIDELRKESAPDLVRIVVAVDPPGSSGEDSAEAGIIVRGIDADGHHYVLADLSGRCTPDEWATRAIGALDTWRADRIIAEANNGGEMVEDVIRTRKNNAPVRIVHASRGKHTRAEPVAALHEQGKEHHVGSFSQLEDQKCTWVPGEKSPDRMDADVWAATDLMENTSVAAGPGGDEGASRWSR